jgi:DNA-binding response OmpR family regulator
MTAKVLIVDDDDATREGLKQLLAGAGYTPIAAASFPEGLRALEAEHLDLMLVDVRLGEYNGLQLVIAAERRIPAIVLTGYADPVLEDDARHEGAEYLVKPVEPSALLAVMKEMLASHRVPRR